MKMFRRLRKFLFEPYRREIYGGIEDEAGFAFEIGRSFSRFDDLLEAAYRFAFRLLVIALALAALVLTHTAMQAIR